MKVKLKSDFFDYYDHWFDLEGIVFQRMTRSGMHRSMMFPYLQDIGERTPRFGTAKKLFDLGVNKVVVYLDEMAHRGEGKLLLFADEAKEKYPIFCSEYLPSNSDEIYSIRRLQIGQHAFWLKYSSTDEWRSNCGDVKIQILKHEKEYHPVIKLPLFSIDYVESNERYAIDFNIAPQIMGTGVEDILSSREVVSIIKEHFV